MCAQIYPQLVNNLTNEIIVIHKDQFTIGRSLSCDYVVVSVKISRVHCLIKKEENSRWILVDKSSNGTNVNETLISNNMSTTLANGDNIKINDYSFTFNNTTTTTTCNDLPTSENELRTQNNPVTDNKIQNDHDPSKELTVGNEDFAIADSDIAAIFDAAEAVAAENPKESSDEAPPKSKKSKIDDDNNQSKIESNYEDLHCSICSELFIKAVTLNCSHTFCKFCIIEWKKRKSLCPICRTKITSLNSTLIIDNLIEKVIEKQDEDFRQTRIDLEKSRQIATSNTFVDETKGKMSIAQAILILDNESSNTDDDDDSELDYNDFDDNYRSYNGAYYGGYGACYRCGNEGHWANGCPY